MESNALNKPICIAVLPLHVLSDHPKGEMFCQGLAMDLIADLSRFRSFRIIAYETTKGLDPNERPNDQKLEDLDLDYLVKGITRYQREKLLFNLQLVNLRQNRLVWAEKLCGGFDELCTFKKKS